MSSEGVAAEIEKLVSLKERGFLTQTEFEQQKARLLADRSVIAPPAPFIGEPAAPPPKRRRRFRVWLLVIIGLVGLYVYVDAFHPDLLLAGIPECGSRTAQRAVEKLVEENSPGLLGPRRIIVWESDVEAARTEASISCRANVLMNNQQREALSYKFEERNGEFLLSINFH